MSRARFLCMDCGIDTGKHAEFYMLIDSVWFSIVGSREGMLCIGCAEIRLGRELTRADFNNSYLNNIHRGIKSARLLDRLMRC